MITPEFIAADMQLHRVPLIEINVEYMTWVFEGIGAQFGLDFAAHLGISAADYIPTVIDDICGQRPPEGIFHLVRLDGALAGMGGLCRLGPELAEVKRLYVRPAFRRAKLGQRLLERVLADARQFGYRQVCLNTALFMTGAHRMYEAAGFVDCPAYEGSEVPEDFADRWRYMQRAL